MPYTRDDITTYEVQLMMRHLPDLHSADTATLAQFRADMCAAGFITRDAGLRFILTDRGLKAIERWQQKTERKVDEVLELQSPRSQKPQEEIGTDLRDQMDELIKFIQLDYDGANDSHIELLRSAATKFHLFEDGKAPHWLFRVVEGVMQDVDAGVFES